MYFIYNLSVGEDYFFSFNEGMTRKGKREDTANLSSELEGYIASHYYQYGF